MNSDEHHDQTHRQIDANDIEQQEEQKEEEVVRYERLNDQHDLDQANHLEQSNRSIKHVHYDEQEQQQQEKQQQENGETMNNVEHCKRHDMSTTTMMIMNNEGDDEDDNDDGGDEVEEENEIRRERFAVTNESVEQAQPIISSSNQQQQSSTTTNNSSHAGSHMNTTRANLEPSVTVSFQLIPLNQIVTMAYPLNSTIKELKENFARELKMSQSHLIFSYDALKDAQQQFESELILFLR